MRQRRGVYSGTLVCEKGICVSLTTATSSSASASTSAAPAPTGETVERKTLPNALRSHVADRVPLQRRSFPAAKFKEVRVGGRHASKLHLAWTPNLLRVRPRAKQIVERLAEVLAQK